MMIIQKCLITDSEDKVLLVRRSKTAPRRPLEWDFPGGFAENVADLIGEVSREVKEETGLTTNTPTLVYASAKRSEEHGVVVFLFYEAKAKSEKIKLSYEHDKYQWAVPSEVIKINTYDIHQQAIRFIYNIQSN